MCLARMGVGYSSGCDACVRLPDNALVSALARSGSATLSSLTVIGSTASTCDCFAFESGHLSACGGRAIYRASEPSNPSVNPEAWKSVHSYSSQKNLPRQKKGRALVSISAVTTGVNHPWHFPSRVLPTTSTEILSCKNEGEEMCVFGYASAWALGLLALWLAWGAAPRKFILTPRLERNDSLLLAFPPLFT